MTFDVMAGLAGLVIAVAVAAAALTITRATVFKPLRLWIKGKNAFIGELFSCPYCMSHWISLIAVLVLKPRIVVSDVPIADYIVSIFFIVAVASATASAIFHTVASISETD